MTYFTYVRAKENENYIKVTSWSTAVEHSSIVQHHDINPHRHPATTRNSQSLSCDVRSLPFEPRSDMTDPVRFIATIWRCHQTPADTDAVGFYSVKNWTTGAWSDHPTTTPADTEELPVHDLYFTPHLFSEARRLRRYALGGRWLFADLDAVDPNGLTDCRPTVAWETSPHRYQCLWLLDRPLNPRRLENLNHRLTYYTGADRGGWSLTKVLRVPGSVSTKYEDPFPVRLLWSESVAHSVTDLRATLADVELPDEIHTPDMPSLRNLPEFSDLYRRRRSRLPVRARQLIRTQDVVTGDDRSKRLWELENILLDAGITAADTFVLVRGTVWNKYAGQRREARMLWQEIARASANRAQAPVGRSKGSAKAPAGSVKGKLRTTPRKHPELRTVTFHDLMTRSLPRASWLVEGIWSDGAHGMIGGESKSFKTLLYLDLAVSVASGTPFLNRFNVPRTGRVLIIQEENDAGDIQDRLMRISSSRGVGPSLQVNGNNPTLDFGHKLPIDIANNTGFALNQGDDMARLERYMATQKPVLVVLDPLYLLTPGMNEDSQQEMTPILSRLLKLKQKYNCGIMIVHHYHKTREHKSHRAAERMSGTGVFHRWLASGVYVERPDESTNTIRLTSEHRSHANLGAFQCTFDLGTPEDLHYAVDVQTWIDSKASKDDDALAQAIAQAAGEWVRVSTLAVSLGVTEDAARRRLQRKGHKVITRRSRNSTHLAIRNPAHGDDLE